MNRRNFLTSSASLVGASLLNRLLINQSGLAAAQTVEKLPLRQVKIMYICDVEVLNSSDLINRKNFSYTILRNKMVTPMAGPGASILQYFASFAAEVASDYVKDSVVDWLKTLTSGDKKTAEDANTMMKNGGFNDYSQDNVYLSNGVYFYGIGHKDDLNVCAPFYPPTNNTPKKLDEPLMIEGPVALGFSFGSKDWQSKEVPRADGLVPKSGNYVPGQLEKSLEEAMYGATKAGGIGVNYQVTNASQKHGEITIASVKDNNDGTYDTLLAKTYGINWT